MAAITLLVALSALIIYGHFTADHQYPRFICNRSGQILDPVVLKLKQRCAIDAQ